MVVVNFVRVQLFRKCSNHLKSVNEPGKRMWYFSGASSGTFGPSSLGKLLAARVWRGGSLGLNPWRSLPPIVWDMYGHLRS